MFVSTVIIYSTTKCSFQMRFELISTVVIYSTTKCSFQMWFELISTVVIFNYDMFISNAARYVEFHVEDPSATPTTL